MKEGRERKEGNTHSLESSVALRLGLVDTVAVSLLVLVVVCVVL